MLASFSAFTGQAVPSGNAQDSENVLNALLGRSKYGRSAYVEQGGTGYCKRRMEIYSCKQWRRYNGIGRNRNREFPATSVVLSK